MPEPSEGSIGARLHEHGHDVTLVARGDHLEAIRAARPAARYTRRLRHPPHRRRAHASPTPPLATATIVLLAVKSQDTAGVLDELVRAAPEQTPIVCVQNGVANERAALRRFPNVYGCCVMCPTAHLEPGVVEAHSAPVTGLLDLGRYPDGVDPVAEAVAAAFEGATFRAEARGGHHGLEVPEAADEPRQRGAGAVWRRPGWAGSRAPGHPGGVGLLRRGRDRPRLARAGRGPARRPAADAAGSVDALAAEDRPGRASARGTGVETDYLNGEIVLLGRLHGVATPVNAALQRLVRQRSAEGHGTGDDAGRRTARRCRARTRTTRIARPAAAIDRRCWAR